MIERGRSHWRAQVIKHLESGILPAMIPLDETIIASVSVVA